MPRLFGLDPEHVDRMLQSVTASHRETVNVLNEQLARLKVDLATKDAELVTLRAQLAAKPDVAEDKPFLPDVVRKELVLQTVGRSVREVQAAYGKANRRWADLTRRGLADADAAKSLAADIARGDEQLADADVGAY